MKRADSMITHTKRKIMTFPDLKKRKKFLNEPLTIYIYITY